MKQEWNPEDSEEITLMCQKEINANLEFYREKYLSIMTFQANKN